MPTVSFRSLSREFIVDTVTYKQAQFVARYRGDNDFDVILSDAALMRTYGTRLPICEKNVGQAKYAFNSVSTVIKLRIGRSWRTNLTLVNGF